MLMTLNTAIEEIRANEILKDVLGAIEASRVQIVESIENGRRDMEHKRSELDRIKEELGKVIADVEWLEEQERIAKEKLDQISNDFLGSSEEDIKEAYSHAAEIRIQHTVMREKERTLKERKSDLEISLRRTLKAIEDGEKILNHIAIAFNFLQGEQLVAGDRKGKDRDMYLGVKILEAQENERKRISRDIHDGPAQHIANIVMKADFCETIARQDLEMGLKELAELKTSTRRALKEVRDIIYDLRPMSLDDLGLNKTLDVYVKNFNKETGIETVAEFTKINVEIESIIQIAAFRLVQEILNNVKKHAKASSVRIRLEYGTKYLRITIKDDGVGFDIQETLEIVRERSTSYGLLGILDRVNQLHGEIDIDSSVGQGTAYSIKLPVSREVMRDA